MTMKAYVKGLANNY